MTLSATYSPEDNKLRLYSIGRLPADLYARVRDAGFHYAPRQDLFVAPMWTPAREDFLMDLCDEIGDEDTSLVDRAEERADRFSDYRDKRAGDAEAAREAASAIADGIPLGQPILVGHHSEARARKDAERIENGMRRAVKMWQTSEYWQRRAAGALRNAKYKERPDVRHRRIKTIEAEQRKAQRTLADINAAAAVLVSPGLTYEQAINLANISRVMYGLWGTLTKDPENYRAHCAASLADLERIRAHYERWLAHYDHRIAYERAMLDEQGGLQAERFNIEPGGQVLIGGEWVIVKRVNKAGGRINSVSTSARYVSVRGIEEVKDYRAPSAEQAAKVKAGTKLPPLCNYPGEGFHQMTKAEWDATHRDYKGSRELGQGALRAGGHRPDLRNAIEAGAQHGRHRVRSVVHRGALVAVYLADSKRVDPPAAPAGAPEQTQLLQEAAPSAEPCSYQTTGATSSTPNSEGQESIDCAACRTETEPSQREKFEALREQLRVGVQIVSTPQLFPTPPNLAARMVRIADPKEGARVLEPSAGTGRILRAIREHAQQTLFGMHIVRTAVEINSRLCDALRIMESGAEIHNRDFLECGEELGKFDSIIMNPPFAGAQDIAHIKNARNMLAPGGTLVAICADGARQNEQLRPLVHACGGMWEPLPAGTFQDAGTGVKTVLLTLHG